MFVGLPENYFKKGSPIKVVPETAGNVNWSIIFEFNQQRIKSVEILSNVPEIAMKYEKGKQNFS